MPPYVPLGRGSRVIVPHGRKPAPLRLCLREDCIGEPRDAKVRAALEALTKAT